MVAATIQPARPPRRPLDSYSPEVLAEWIKRSGFSYFPEEFDYIEAELAGYQSPSYVPPGAALAKGA